VRSGARGQRVREKPSRAFRHHREVRENMSRSTIRAFGALGTLLLTVTVVTPAFAIDKEQRQLMADVRMLQEQNQQLQNLLASIAESIKAVNARMDDQANATRKAQADQKLVIDNL